MWNATSDTIKCMPLSMVLKLLHGNATKCTSLSMVLKLLHGNATKCRPLTLVLKLLPKAYKKTAWTKCT